MGSTDRLRRAPEAVDLHLVGSCRQVFVRPSFAMQLIGTRRCDLVPDSSLGCAACERPQLVLLGGHAYISCSFGIYEFEYIK